MDGFFSKKEIELTNPRLGSCFKCGLYKNCITPRMKPTGKGEKGIFVLAEAPGALEDKKGVQLIGKTGQILRKKLDCLGINLDRDCIKMNSINCRPEGNRTPTKLEILTCRRRVLKEINKYKPKLIILLGKPALESIIGNRWKKSLGKIGTWRGWGIPEQYYKAWVLSTYHPSFVEREKYNNPVVELIFTEDLEKALKLSKKSFPEPLPIEDGVTPITSDIEAIRCLKDILDRRPEIISFDFETTGLKPHKKDHKIVSCSISLNSKSAYSFMINNNKIIKELLKKILIDSKIKKVGANIKFEHNWAREKLGIEIDGWEHDVCLYQHLIDNRPGVCSVKFITYIYNGFSDYDSHINPFLKGDKKDANSFNKIQEIPIRELLLYNGIDSKMEFSIYEKQIK